MKKTRGESTQQSDEAQRALDRGRFDEALARHEAGEWSERGDGPSLWRAEVSLYLDRLEDAAVALGPFGASPDDGAPNLESCRARLVRAEIALAEGRYAEVESWVRPVLASAAAREEPAVVARAWYDLGRFSLEQGAPAIALEHLLVARQYARLAESDYLEGRIAHERAEAWRALGDFRAAEACYGEALGLLARSENLRFRASAENAFAEYLAERERPDEALELAFSAERTAADLGLGGDALRAGATAARALAELGRYKDAIERANQALGRDRGPRSRRAEAACLRVRSVATCAIGDYDAAVESAEEARRLSELVGSPAAALDARLLAARARARAGDEAAVAELRDLRVGADEAGLDSQRFEARIYLAEALVGSAPIEAAALCEEARQLPIAATNRWFGAELERVERLVTTAPIRVEPEGIFQVDVRTQWPSLKSAREALERFLITKAVESTGGNLAAAGRLIGETRFQMHYLWKMMHDAPARPALSESAAAKSRKRRPRNLFADRRK